MTGRQRAGFTLLELLVVVLIIGLVSGMITFMPRGDQRRANVEAAANELAETMRLAHNLALDHRAIYAIVFNIQNQPGTSGVVLNNWSGGHWYQILGPDDSPISRSLTGWTMNNNGEPMCPYPYFNAVTGETHTTFLREVKSSWVGDRHILPARKVRFLALTDEDNGGSTQSYGWGWGGFSATYPRFWFGWWDQTNKLLRPWGGYDPNFVGHNGLNSSGFNYEGADSATHVIGCINPTSYFTTDAINGDTPVEFLAKGAGRPLVNGEWMDYAILFLPDGTIRQYHMGAARLISAYNAPYTLSPWSIRKQNPPTGASAAMDGLDWSVDPATSFFPRTGFLFITLAPDTDQDSESFPNVNQAYSSIMPAFRVGISKVGDVEVFPVHTTLLPGTQLDSTFTSATNWTTTATTQNYYQKNMLTNSDGSPRGTPIYDRLTTTMMQIPQSWSNP
jgi:prepilin-type N-terminal cleavage/methylation domain-containing protein